MKKQKNKQLKQVQNQAQEGRSMVEMLGVLAIVGVLSIGGITGYSWGMDKHVANQILNEINLNSLQLAMLLQRGNEEGVTLALGSPYDDENPTFRTVNYGFQYGCGDNAEVADPECEYINETRYFITALDLPERVQKMVAESAENLQYATAVETDETDGFVTVFFDVDAGVTEYESRPEESETRTPAPEVTEPTTTTTTETTTPETTTTEATTTTESTTEATTTTESTTTLTTTTVTTTTQPKSCEDLHCEADEFCLSNGCSNYCDESCTKFECVEITDTNIVKGKVDGKNLYGSSSSMTWWSAKRFCEAAKSKVEGAKGIMVSWGGSGIDWQCYSGTDNTDRVPDPIGKNDGSGYCKKTSKSLGSNNVSETIKDLREMYCGSGKRESSCSYYPWLKDEYVSCFAYYVHLDGGRVSYTTYGTPRHALCE